MTKYLNAECVFTHLTKYKVLECEDSWKKERQQIPFSIPCFLCINSKTGIRYFSILVKGNDYLLSFNSIESLLWVVEEEHKKYIYETLENCLVT